MGKSKSKNGFLSNNWIVGIGTTVLATFVLKLVDWIWGTRIIFSAWNWIVSIPSTLFIFFTTSYEFPLYGLILIFLSAPTVLFLVVWILLIRERREEKLNEVKLVDEKKVDIKKEVQPPKWKNYNQDNFDGVLYRWSYHDNPQGDILIISIKSYCPHCTCLIIDYKCPNCKKYYSGGILKSDEVVRALVLHRIENNPNDY